MTRLFIDGREGTTGLRIFERLQDRKEFEVLTLPDHLRKDPGARKEALNAADVAILCLPDAAARESVALLEGNNHTRVLDTSTAHRTLPDWAYGFPELSADRRERIINGMRVAVPGCHASGMIALVAPLVAGGLLGADVKLSCFSLTGYSGGGKKMIAQYEGADRDRELDSPRQYGLAQTHKHLPEMKMISGLDTAPIFAPVVSDYYSGMVMTIPLFPEQVKAKHPLESLREALADHYAGSRVIHVMNEEETAALGGFLGSNNLSGRDGMEIMVVGNDERMELVSRFDNLGKGSSGAALQCLNLMTGTEETLGLNL